MKLLGSRIVRIGCMECVATSDKFRVTLAEDEVDGNLFFPRGYPGGWMAPAEAELIEDMIYGYCPEHTHLLGL